MKSTRPLVIKIGETIVYPDALKQVMEQIGVSEPSIERLLKTRGADGQALIEFAGRMCYESYEPGLNPNVKKIRESAPEYFTNVISRGDGSLLEHGWVSFAILNASRVTTHEIVRHRVGTAISQESLRYVRPREIKFWIPDELTKTQADAIRTAVQGTERAYRELEETIPWDDLPMEQKKRMTSALRRILPDGIATNLIWSANHRTLRWVIEMRTDPSAEVEIRIVFDQIAEICKRDYEHIYSDFESRGLPDGTSSWKPRFRSKV